MVETGEILDSLHTTLNFKDLHAMPKGSVKKKSKELYRKFCDKDQHYFKNQADMESAEWNKLSDIERIMQEQKKADVQRDM